MLEKKPRLCALAETTLLLMVGFACLSATACGDVADESAATEKASDSGVSDVLFRPKIDGGGGADDTSVAAVDSAGSTSSGGGGDTGHGDVLSASDVATTGDGHTDGGGASSNTDGGGASSNTDGGGASSSTDGGGASSNTDVGSVGVDASSADATAADVGPVDPCAAGIKSKETCDGVDNDCDGKTDNGTCSDGNPCTTDECFVAGSAAKCTHANANAVACDADGSVCTEKDLCVDGACKPGKMKVCDDGDVCTFDSCAMATGCTSIGNDGAFCDADGNNCTLADSCLAGLCVAGTPKLCSDGNACTLDSCNSKTGACLFDAATMTNARCDSDGDVCTDKDTCTAGACVTGKKLLCDDANQCTEDKCASKVGCVYTNAKHNAECSDGQKCTYGDSCITGKCVGKMLKCPGPAHSCISMNVCKPSSGLCTPVAAPDSQPCDDGDKCTTGDQCIKGKCVAGTNGCGEVTLVPVADSWVYKGSSSSNYGGSKELYCGQSVSNSNKRYVFLKFDMSTLPPGAKVETAVLTCTAFKGYAWGNDGNVYTHYVSDDSWTEKGIKWNNQPKISGSSLGKWFLWYNHVAKTQIGKNNNPLLAKQVESELAGDRVLSLRLHSIGYETRYRSREYNKKSERPQLYIKYTKP